MLGFIFANEVYEELRKKNDEIKITYILVPHHIDTHISIRRNHLHQIFRKCFKDNLES